MKCIYEGCPGIAVNNGLCLSCFNSFYQKVFKRINQPGHHIKGREIIFKHDYQNPIHSNYDLIHDFNSIGPGHKLKGMQE